GRTTRIDTLRVQLQQGEARTRLANTREQYLSKRRRLAELMGQSDIGDATLEEPPLLLVDHTTPAEAVQTALANRLDYADTQQSYADAYRAARIAKQNTRPGLKLVTGYERLNGSEFIDSGRAGNENAWFVRLVADTDSDRRRQGIEYKQSVLRQGQAMEDIRARNLAITREVEEALASHRRAHQQLDVLEGNFQHAGARLKLARRLFSVGRADGFSVTDAEQAYFNAQSRWLSGRSEASVSGYRLLHATGTLIEAPAAMKPGAF
ncbi:MAG: TolC family protein, partial [Halioglobus sp.]|nr:TolC family protein [Halioglobus sp.]